MLPRSFASLPVAIQAAAERKFGPLKARAATYDIVGLDGAIARWVSKHDYVWA